MKFIVDNYSGPQTSQALYLYQYIQQISGNDVFLNNGNRYIFDLMDEHNPDVYIASCHTLSYDVIRYLESERQNIILLINIDGAKQGEVYTIEDSLLSKKINFKLFGNNSAIEKVMTKKTKIFNLLDGADLNIVEHKEHWKNKINTMFVIEDSIDVMNIKSIADKKDRTFHLVSFNKPTEVTTSIIEARRVLYHNYDNIIFAGLEHGLKQYFFEAILFGSKVYFVSNNHAKEIDELIQRVFKLDISLDYHNNNRLEDFEELRNVILNKHTGHARAKSLLSQLPQEVS